MLSKSNVLAFAAPSASLTRALQWRLERPRDDRRMCSAQHLRSRRVLAGSLEQRRACAYVPCPNVCSTTCPYPWSVAFSRTGGVAPAVGSARSYSIWCLPFLLAGRVSCHHDRVCVSCNSEVEVRPSSDRVWALLGVRRVLACWEGAGVAGAQLCGWCSRRTALQGLVSQCLRTWSRARGVVRLGACTAQRADSALS